MATITREFERRREAEAFVEGLTYVNDAAIQDIDITPHPGCYHVTFNDCDVTNETVNEAFFSHDFVLVETGGGCQAFRHDMEGGYYILVTDTQGSGLPERIDEPCCVGLYREVNGPGKPGLCEHKTWDTENVSHALHIAKFDVGEYLSKLEGGA